MASRIFDLPNGTRVIKYFLCFGFKFCASRKLVSDDAFMERFAVAYMLEGYPKKDEFASGDIERLLTLRDKLLKWRMQSTNAPLPDVDPQVTGRLKELWKPLLQVAASIGNEKELMEALTRAYHEYRREREESFEVAVLHVYIDALPKAKDESVTSDEIWNSLITSLEEMEDPKNPTGSTPRNMGISARRSSDADLLRD